MRFLRNCRKLLVLSWRPGRDLNPCYRRESFSELKRKRIYNDLERTDDTVSR